MDSAKAEKMETLKKENLSVLTDKINQKSTELMAMLKDKNPDLHEDLTEAMKAFNKGDIEEALDEFKEVYQGHVTTDQMEVAKDIASNMQIFALESEFKATDGPVGQAIGSIRNQDHAQALKSLQDILKKGQLSSKQKDIVEEIMKYYTESTHVMEDSLKSFGL